MNIAPARGSRIVLAAIPFFLILMVIPGSQILIYPILWILMPSVENVTLPASGPTVAAG